MIILTDKQLQALKEEIKSDLRREVTQSTADMIVQVFQSIFVNIKETTSAVAQQMVKTRLDDEWWDRVWFGKAPEKKKTFHDIILKSAFSIERILDQRVKTQYKDEIDQLVTEYVESESFIDQIISRINRKQLVGGKQ